MQQTQSTIRRIGLSLIAERKEAALAECLLNRPGLEKYDSNAAYTGKPTLSRDLLSILGMCCADDAHNACVFMTN